MVNGWEAAFLRILLVTPTTDIKKLVFQHAEFQLPLLMAKTQVDVMIGMTELKLPDEDRPYHPQEPDVDPFQHIWRRFR